MKLDDVIEARAILPGLWGPIPHPAGTNLAQLEASGQLQKGLHTANASLLMSDSGSLSSVKLSSNRRKKILVVGNSIATLTGDNMTGGNAVAATAPSKAGQPVVKTNNANAWLANDNIFIQHYDGSRRLYTVASYANPDVTLTTNLEKAVNSTAAGALDKTTTPAIGRTNSGTAYGNVTGILNIANIVGGGQYDITAIGIYNAKASEILYDLAKNLTGEYDYCLIHLFENDIGSTSLTDLERYCYQFIDLCLQRQIIPIIASCLPRTTFTTAQAVAGFDWTRETLKDLIINYSSVARHVDISGLYLDTTQTDRRVPLAGYTDNVHPNLSKLVAIGKSALLKFQETALFSDADYLAQPGLLYGTNPTLSGGATVATGWTAGQNTLTSTKSKSPEDKQILDISYTGTTNYFSQLANLTQTVTLPYFAGGQKLQGVARFKISNILNIGTVYLQITCAGNIVRTLFSQDCLSTAVDGDILTIETAELVIPNGAADYTILLEYRPKNSATNTTCRLEFDFIGALLKS